jgi:TRAP-type mannitol/chloroaromatic compound transport system permease small subunit
MNALLRVAGRIEQFVCVVGRGAGWLALVLVTVIVFDVLFRRWSTTLQELEWHLHGALFLLTLGYAYLRGAHVRIELVHERLSPRAKAWIEFIGLLAALIPYCIVIIWFGYEYALRAFLSGEGSPSPGGLQHRWIIKTVLIAGFALLGLAGFARLLRSAVYLFGPSDLSDRTGFANGTAVAEAREKLEV